MKKGLYALFFKRFLDIFLSLLAIIILSPLMLIIYIISLFALKGNPIFKQYRPGKNGKLFALCKFRSMNYKKDKDGNLLPDKDRITKWGKILRKSSLDELPQLFNILKGDMSIIGPRPRLVQDMIFYPEEVMKAYSVRPGLSSPCQINGGRSEASWENIFASDLKYAENITFWGDVKVIFQTIKAVFFSREKGSVEGSATSKRDYFYADYLLKTGKITKVQYNLGIVKSQNLEKRKGIVKYDKELHNKNID